MSELLLGIDIGTSSSKAVLATPGGEQIAVAERAHELSLPRPGWAEHDAESIWWSDVLALCQELLPKATGRIAGICISGIGPCMLLTDVEGKPLRPAILYGIDTRATQEIEELTAKLGSDRILERCGSALTTQAIGPKMLWVRRHEPDVWQGARRFLMASSFVIQRLTGEYVLDHHSASQCDPLYDLHENRWIEEWAHDIAPGLPLPRLAWPSDVVGTVTADAAAITGIPAGTPVVAGTVDAWAEAASVGVSSPGDLMVMYGTTMFFVEVLQHLQPHPTFWGTAGLFPGTVTRAGGMATSGALTSWFREIVGGVPYETLLSEAAAVPAGAEGLVVLPYFAGERTPVFDPEARGLILGLTLRHGRGHLYRSLLEATAFGVRHNLDAMGEIGGGNGRLVAVGGGTRGGLWTQIVSDVTGRVQDLPGITTGAAFGDAYLAGIGVVLVARDIEWNPVRGRVEPDQATRKIYDDLYTIYRELYPATRDQAHALARLQTTG